MSNQESMNQLYLKLLEAFQTEKAFKAAEEAFNSAKRENVEAKTALAAATEAFKTASCKNPESEKISTPVLPEHENGDPEETEDDFTKDDLMSPPFLLRSLPRSPPLSFPSRNNNKEERGNYCSAVRALS